MSAISLLAVLALAAVILFNGRSKPKYVMPPPWMMQQQPPKKKVNSNGNGATPAASPTNPVVSQPPTAPAFQEDPGVLQSEMTKTRESVVSMSVGDPDVATAVVKDWLEQEAPPQPEAPEAAPEATPEQADDNDTSKKKKKK